MVYTAVQGIDNQFAQRIVRASALVLPVLAAAVLVVGLLSFSLYGAAGQNPDITLPATSGPALSSRHSGSTSPNNNSGSAGLQAPSAAPNSGLAATYSPGLSDTSLSTTPVVSGMGGGDSGGTPVVTTGDGNADNPVQTTVTVPPINIQVGDKGVVSTDPVSITIN